MTTPDTAPTPERVGEVLRLSQGAVEAFGSDYTVGITAGGLALLCRDWLRLRGRQAKATSLLTEGVQIAKDAHRLEADLVAQNSTLSAALAEAKSLLWDVIAAWLSEANDGDGIREENGPILDAARAFLAAPAEEK